MLKHRVLYMCSITLYLYGATNWITTKLRCYKVTMRLLYESVHVLCCLINNHYLADKTTAHFLTLLNTTYYHM